MAGGISAAPSASLRSCRPAQAVLTELRNLLTSTLRRSLSPDSDRAAVRTCEEADPVSAAPPPPAGNVAAPTPGPSPPCLPLPQFLPHTAPPPLHPHPLPL